jgi:hypothetical protein
MSGTKFALMLKSYDGDITFAERLFRSIDIHNVEHIPVYVVVPRASAATFAKIASATAVIVPEEDFSSYLSTDPVNGVRPGYVNQSIIKLAFWESSLCDNYLCLDSDAVFIRDFVVADFMSDDEIPYTILVEDNDLQVDPVYYRTFWESRKTSITKIQEVLGVDSRVMLSTHGFSIFSAKVLAELKAQFMQPQGMSYVDLLAISGYEFSWYNMFLQRHHTIPIRLREPMFKVFHHKGHHLALLAQKVTLEDLARGYIGLVVNSNYSRGYGVLGYGDSSYYEPTLSEVGGSYRVAIATTARMLVSFPRRIVRRIRRTLSREPR